MSAKFVLVLGILVLQTLSTRGTNGTALPNATQIIELAVKRTTWGQDNSVHEQFTFKKEIALERLGDAGSVKSTETKLYQSVPVHGIRYNRLIEKNGGSLSSSELAKERVKEQQFRRRLTNAEDSQKNQPEALTLNLDLVSRYRFTLLGRERIEGRETYVLSFGPRAGKLPVDREIDHALNIAVGRVWIDAEVFELTRLEFECQDLKVMLGLGASYSEIRGRLERGEVSNGFWYHLRSNIYMNGRKFFYIVSDHSREKAHWFDFEVQE